METTGQESAVRHLLLDLDHCIECRSCAAACYYGHADMPAVHFARGGLALLPTVCRQCKDAPCVAACPTEAMVRDKLGVVRRRVFRCTGCGSCAAACPFGVIPTELCGVPVGYRSPNRLSGRQVGKCDLCEDRIGDDPQGIPRCAAACPAGAILFIDQREAQRQHAEMLGGRTTCQNLYKRR